MSEKLRKFYETVDTQSANLQKIHAARLNCRKGCAACCVDELTVFEIEAENIRANHRELLENKKPREAGKCAFLDETDACRIYENRPYICRTQGLPFRWLDEFENELVELRDICPLNEEGEPLENLPANQCWTIGEFEAILAVLQKESGSGGMKRIALRDLFVGG